MPKVPIISSATTIRSLCDSTIKALVYYTIHIPFSGKDKDHNDGQPNEDSGDESGSVTSGTPDIDKFLEDRELGTCILNVHPSYYCTLLVLHIASLHIEPCILYAGGSAKKNYWIRFAIGIKIIVALSIITNGFIIDREAREIMYLVPQISPSICVSV